MTLSNIVLCFTRGYHKFAQNYILNCTKSLIKSTHASNSSTRNYPPSLRSLLLITTPAPAREKPEQFSVFPSGTSCVFAPIGVADPGTSQTFSWVLRRKSSIMIPILRIRETALIYPRIVSRICAWTDESVARATLFSRFESAMINSYVRFRFRSHGGEKNMCALLCCVGVDIAPVYDRVVMNR